MAATIVFSVAAGTALASEQAATSLHGSAATPTAQHQRLTKKFPGLATVDLNIDPTTRRLTATIDLRKRLPRGRALKHLSKTRLLIDLGNAWDPTVTDGDNCDGDTTVSVPLRPRSTRNSKKSDEPHDYVKNRGRSVKISLALPRGTDASKLVCFRTTLVQSMIGRFQRTKLEQTPATLFDGLLVPAPAPAPLP